MKCVHITAVSQADYKKLSTQIYTYRTQLTAMLLLNYYSDLRRLLLFAMLICLHRFDISSICALCLAISHHYSLSQGVH